MVAAGWGAHHPQGCGHDCMASSSGDGGRVVAWPLSWRQGWAFGGGCRDCRGTGTNWQLQENSGAIPQTATESLKKKKCSCSSLQLQTSTWLLTQPNFPTRPETIQVRVCHGPPLLPSPNISQLCNFSGNDPASIHSLIGCTLPLCICHFVLIPPVTSSIQVHPDAAQTSLFGRGGSC